MIRFFRVCLRCLLERVRQDVSQYSTRIFSGYGAGAAGGRLKQVLSGIGRLSQAEVARLAQVFGQSSETYLVDAGYLSESARLLFGRNPNCVNILPNIWAMPRNAGRIVALWGGVRKSFRWMARLTCGPK